MIKSLTISFTTALTAVPFTLLTSILSPISKSSVKNVPLPITLVAPAETLIFPGKIKLSPVALNMKFMNKSKLGGT